MAKNIVIETQERIRQLIENKEQELEHIQEELKKAGAEYAEASSDIEAATAATDLSMYTAAKTRQLEAKNKQAMYKARYTQLLKAEFVSEAESDEVIASLLAYEDELAEKYACKTNELIATLSSIHEDYRAEVAATEKTIREWTGQIHANYINPTGTYAGGTHRSPNPIPVHNTPYLGSARSRIVDRFLETVNKS